VKIVFSERAWEDYLYWQGQDRKILARINHLIREVQRDPVAGGRQTRGPEARPGRILVPANHR
jgi:Txe/YoeB family toxin of Txe-Axe toxin-antitoxin module